MYDSRLKSVLAHQCVVVRALANLFPLGETPAHNVHQPHRGWASGLFKPLFFLKDRSGSKLVLYKLLILYSPLLEIFLSNKHVLSDKLAFTVTHNYTCIDSTVKGNFVNHNIYSKMLHIRNLFTARFGKNKLC